MCGRLLFLFVWCKVVGMFSRFISSLVFMVLKVVSVENVSIS